MGGSTASAGAAAGGSAGTGGTPPNSGFDAMLAATALAANRSVGSSGTHTAYRIYSRAGVLGDDSAGFATWKAQYRAKFFERFPFEVPAVVPQTNNVQNPAQGMPYYEGCQATQQLPPPPRIVTASSRRQGCIGDL
jgi:hypothetical protein